MRAAASSAGVIPVLSAGNFVIGMGAFMVVGLLNPVAEAFSISPARAGWLMIVYAMGYAVLSPILVSVTGQIGRRRVLVAALTLFALANGIAALAPTEATLLAARVLAAAGAGIFTPVAAAVAAGLSPPERQARALASVFFGLTLAQVLGVPVGGYIAYTFGWRAAFAVVLLLAVPVIVLLWFRVPAGLAFRPLALSDLGRVLVDLRLMLAVAFTTVFLGSIYVIYTFISPLLSTTMGYGRDGITLILLLFGLGAVAGNLIGGQLSDRIGPFRTLLLLALAQTAIMPAFSLLPLPQLALIILSIAWAAFGWSFMAAQQVRLIALAPHSAGVLLALNAAAIYVGAALGSAAGGMVIARFGLPSLGVAGGIGALLAMGVLLSAQHLDRQRGV